MWRMGRLTLEFETHGCFFAHVCFSRETSLQHIMKNNPLLVQQSPVVNVYWDCFSLEAQLYQEREQSL
jgi:hypothetical protein